MPAGLFAATLASEVAAVALTWGLKPSYDTAVYAVYALTSAGAGALIASRHPANPIGWLFCVAALWNALAADVAQGWGLRAAESGWSGGTVGEVIALTSWMPSGLAIVLTFLLFPDGRLLRPAWRILVWVQVLGILLATPGWAVSADLGPDFVANTNPYAVDNPVTAALRVIGTTLFLGSFAASVVPLTQRLRRSTGLERQQLKLFAFAAVWTVIILAPSPILWNVTPVVRPLVAVAATAVPIATCIAILRYRLYDIDVVISRTLAYGVLTVFLAATYAASVVVIGAAAGRDSAWATAGATLAVAAAFGPLRRRVQDVVDRRFNRARFAALQQMTVFLDDLRAGRAAPEEVERALRAALAVDDLEVRLFLPDSGLAVDLSGTPVADDPGDGRRRWPIRHAGTTLGTLLIPAEHSQNGALVAKVLDAGALAIEIARLRVGLRHQLEAVEASRARIVVAADEERRRLERDLHDGAQQRLVSIGLALRHAQHALGSAVETEVNRTLDDAVAEITVAIDELRGLAGGLRPAQLEGGVGPALRDLARRAPLPVEVDVNSDRFPADVETAAYFTACEGLTNAIKHARATKVVLRAFHEDGRLVVSVVDDGVGGALPTNRSGLTGLSDRVAARGGTLRIDSAAGHGTTLLAVFPCAS
ncbi:MAG: Two-component system sensor histidine kinase [uncultured Solirubrobacteraceae bacterium]|uniref:histidine kinase n=1 Tax=uncultured Solirubrobacteraceae bacterium TaxID=1162706 RepID=A0A6J4SIQ3_9ACTN|nr:MAG: Two-component system sensor histidine kinase [uncultured Solirubrobacteraceae bacterium]